MVTSSLFGQRLYPPVRVRGAGYEPSGIFPGSQEILCQRWSRNHDYITKGDKRQREHLKLTEPLGARADHNHRTWSMTKLGRPDRETGWLQARCLHWTQDTWICSMVVCAQHKPVPYIQLILEPKLSTVHVSLQRVLSSRTLSAESDCSTSCCPISSIFVLLYTRRVYQSSAGSKVDLDFR